MKGQNKPEYRTALSVRNAIRASLDPWDPLLADLLRRYRFDAFPGQSELLADVNKLHKIEGTEKAVNALLVLAFPTLDVEGEDVELIKWKPNRHRYKGRLVAVYQRRLTALDTAYLYCFANGTKRERVYSLKLDKRGAKKLIKRG
jgi:hypothetical protein